MIRIETSDGWLLVTHPDHARLAGDFARVWGNENFAPPEPVDDVLDAVSTHDDGWAARDAEPLITRDGRPSAFSKELVGTYAAFEEIDLADYLRVRGAATEVAAARNPFAAILISMHTCNLLTEQMHANPLAGAGLTMLTEFLSRQLERRRELIKIAAESPQRAPFVIGEPVEQAFRFLQACDHLSLLTCVDFAQPAVLRHSHPDRGGKSHEFRVTPLGDARFVVSPWPFADAVHEFFVPFRSVIGRTFSNHKALQDAWAQAPIERRRIEVVAA